MVRFNCVFDNKMTKSLNSYSIKKLWVVCILLGMAFLFLGVAAILEQHIYTAIFFFAFVFFYPIIFILSIKFSQKNIDKSMSLLSEQTQIIYEFYEDKVKIETKKGDDFYSLLETKYSYFYKIIENENNFLLFISKTQCHVVDKSGLKEGSLEELKTYFRNKILAVKLKFR